ncbi:MAG TPA: hypothetical protein VFZ34_22400 [Blastocatellia bacterium]|nr:hypothetical protein [Blastocatellia bacterium]
MDKIFVLLALLAGLPLTVQSQSLLASPPPAQFEKEFFGTINSTLKIRLRLTRQGDELSGSYAYDKRKKDIRLQGTVNAQGYFQMTEFGAPDTITGHFVGAFTRDGAMVGFWSKEFSGSPKLRFLLTEHGQSASPHSFAAITARVRRDAGQAQILLIDDTIIEFTYENVGRNAHTCTVTTDRSETRVHWQTAANVTTIRFPKEYFNDNENSAMVVIEQNAKGYTVTFDGYGQYFCGARARLPRQVRLTRTGGGWTGEK